MRRALTSFVVLLVAVACGWRRPSIASSSKCEPATLAAVWTTAGPVYRSCEVDREAKPIGEPPAIKWTPPVTADRCNTALVEFVVDTLGVPEARGARIVRATNPEFGLLHLKSVAARRYSAATKAGIAVRQVVREPVMMLVRFDIREVGSSRDTLCKL